MFFRCLPVSRFPAAVIRRCGNSVPSTISANFSRASVALSRCNIHVIPTSTPQWARHFGTSAVSARFVDGKKSEEAVEMEGAKTQHNDDSNDNGNMDAGDLKALNWILAFAALGFSSIIMSAIAQVKVDGKQIPADAEEVDFEEFVKKYLGKVKKVVIVENRCKAVATLHPGAIIDGKPAKSDHIVFYYPYPVWRYMPYVGTEEAKMGASPLQNVEIEKFINPVEMFVGKSLGVIFLCTLVAAVANGMGWKAALGAFSLILGLGELEGLLDNSPELHTKAIPAGAPRVDFGTFAQKYLRTGEVQKITFLLSTGDAVATIRPGALIDGKPAESGHVVIDYPHRFIFNRTTLTGLRWDVRKEEKEMGIAPEQGVTIESFNPNWGLRWFIKACQFLTAYYVFQRCSARCDAKVQAVHPPVPIRGMLHALGRKAKVFSLIVVLAAMPEYFRMRSMDEKPDEEVKKMEKMIYAAKHKSPNQDVMNGTLTATVFTGWGFGH